MGRPCPVTKEQELEIVARYMAGESRNALALAYKASRWFIADCVRRHGGTVRNPKEGSQLANCLPVNHEAFQKPLGPEACYWVGFMMADGCVHVGRHSTPYVILGLSMEDRCHVESFRSFLKSEHAIRDTPPSERAMPNGQVIKSGWMSTLCVSSAQLAQDLASFGVVPNKTHRTLAHPALATNRHFWRGMVDGDGWVGTSLKHGQKNPRINLLGTKPILEQFAAYMRSVTPDWKAM